MRYSQDGPAVAEHQARVRGIICPRPPLLVPLDAAEGRVLAANVTAACPLPAFADAVIPVESTNGGLRNVSVTAFPAPGSNIRRRGEDIQPGARALEAGTVLGPAQLGLLSALGQEQVLVRPALRVLLISTGSELSAPGTVPGTAQVRDANSIMLAAAVRACGAVVQRSHVVIHPGSHAARAPAGRGSVLRHPGRRAAGQPGERLHLEVFLRPALRAAMGFDPPERPTAIRRLASPVDSCAGVHQFRLGVPGPGGTCALLSGHRTYSSARPRVRRGCLRSRRASLTCLPGPAAPSGP